MSEEFNELLLHSQITSNSKPNTITLLERISSALLSKRRFLPITWFGLWFTYFTDNKKTDKQIPPESKVKTSLHNYEQDQVLRNYIVMKQNDSVFVCRSDLCYDRGRHSARLNAVNYWWLISTFFLSPACWFQLGSICKVRDAWHERSFCDRFY